MVPFLPFCFLLRLPWLTVALQGQTKRACLVVVVCPHRHALLASCAPVQSGRSIPGTPLPCYLFLVTSSRDRKGLSTSAETHRCNGGRSPRGTHPRRTSRHSPPGPDGSPGTIP